MKKINGIIMQYFEWYLNCEKGLWNKVIEESEKLSRVGVTALWLPPAYKGIGGKNEVGYGPYDLYDLGEFDQQGSIATKYGTKDEYLEAIQVLKQAGIESYADIVLNHKMGADFLQIIKANKVEWANHNVEISQNETLQAATKFTFPNRKNKYSNFKWNWTHFDGIDYNNATGEHSIFKFKDKQWQNEVDDENGNYDYLMGADLDFYNPEVVEECKNWGKWYMDFTDVDGFRLDAVKHIPSSFYNEWMKYLKEYKKRNIFAVGEYWTGDVQKLHRYITETEGQISLFDVPLHYNFYTASQDPNYDMSRLLDNTLLKENPLKAVTFVDNHDTQPGQALQSFIEPWFKQIAYSIILLKNDGYPCVFYGDYYGIPYSNIEKMDKLENLMILRKDKAYGLEHDYFDHDSVIGFTREGDDEHIKSGLAVIASNKIDGEKRMYIGEKFAGETFIDALGNFEEEVTIDEDGCGVFKVKNRTVSVWVEK